MNIRFIVLLWLLPLFSYSQTYFEGEIIYNLEYIKKDPSFNLQNIPSWPSKTATSIVKNGNWIQWMDDGNFEYEYFNRKLNRQYYKVTGSDTLLFLNYGQRSADQDSILSMQVFKATDTILGKVCDKFILQTRKRKLTLLYNRYLKIDPVWYKNTKGGYYDIIYSHTKSLFLMAVIETDSYISKITARQVIFKKIPDKAFPDVANMPKRKVE